MATDARYKFRCLHRELKEAKFNSDLTDILDVWTVPCNGGMVQQGLFNPSTVIKLENSLVKFQLVFIK